MMLRIVGRAGGQAAHRLGGKGEKGPGPQRGQNPCSGDGDIMCQQMVKAKCRRSFHAMVSCFVVAFLFFFLFFFC